MNRTVKYALSVALSAVFVVPAFAQSDTPFPDTKENHWAYEAVTRLKAEGILVGYPNGKFIGGRLATRYEMAVAINAAYTKLKALTDGLSKQIDDINGKITELQNKGGPSQADFDALKAALNDLKDQVDGMKSYGQDIADLKKLTDQFAKDLASLGVDVDDLKKGLAGLDKRVTALEKRKLPIDISGEVNTVSLNGYSQSGFGIDEAGRPNGVGRGPVAPGGMGGHPVGADQDFTFLHEVALGFKTTNDTGAKGEATIVVGDMMGASPAALNNAPGAMAFSQVSQGAAAPYGEGQEAVYLQKAFVSYDWAAAGFTGSGRAGRIPLKLGKYILERPDFTPYYHNKRWDNGNYDVDGFMVGGKFGGVGVHVFAARAGTSTDSAGNPVQTMVAGSSIAAARANGLSATYGNTAPFMTVNQLLGANLWLPIGKSGNVSLDYVLLDSNTFTPDASLPAGNSANRIAVWGGDASFKFGMIKVWGGYSRSDVYFNNHSLLTKNNQRMTGYAGYKGDKWGVSAGYRYIEPFFGAPGYWGRIGNWWNPTDIEGVDAAAHLDVMSAFTLKGTFEYYTGTGKVSAANGGLQTSTKITRFTAGLSHKFGSSTTVDLGFEENDFKAPGVTGTPHERWYNIGAKYDFSDKTSFSVLWQISDYNGAGNAAFALPFNTNNSGGNIARGGLITTQFSVRF
ncbi:MAG: S-layer homology domain-containing protein [Fimbriimonadaceae bacterium]